MNDSSDQEYENGNDSTFFSSEEEEEDDGGNLSSPSSSFDMIEGPASQSEELLHDIQHRQEEGPIDEGPTSFQLNSVFANTNADSSKDVKLLRDNFFICS